MNQISRKYNKSNFWDIPSTQDVLFKPLELDNSQIMIFQTIIYNFKAMSTYLYVYDYIEERKATISRPF